MSVNDSDPTAGPRRWTALPFAAATLLGAFLLFQVQPLIGKFILPWFGGAPAVWTTCMLFFQISLFGGYAYSHLLVERLSLRGQAVAQCGLLLVALFMLPIVPADSWKPMGDETPTARILLLLAATVGLPYFVLATTSPLIQSWFSRVHLGRAPYRLYALSNVGSLAALLSYPFVFEPAFSLNLQARIWSWSFAAYVLIMVICAAVVGRFQSPLTPRPSQAQGRATLSTKRPTPRLRLLGGFAHCGCCCRPVLRLSFWPRRTTSAKTSPRGHFCGSCRSRSIYCRSSSASIIHDGTCGRSGRCPR